MCNIGSTILHHLRFTFEDVSSFLSSFDISSCTDKLLHGHGWLDGLRMERWILLNPLVNRDSGVDHCRLDNFAFNDRLNSFVDMMMVMLSNDSVAGFGCVYCGENFPRRFEFRTLRKKKDQLVTKIR